MLITDESIEFENYPVEGQDCRKITDYFRRIHGVHLKLMKEN